MIQRVKHNSNWAKLYKLDLTKIRIRVNLTKTFEIIHGISNYGRNLFDISLRSKQVSKTKSINQLKFVFFFSKE